MSNPVQLKEAIAGARLVEFLSSNPPWTRSLWCIGLTLELRELHEAVGAMRDGSLGEPSIKNLCDSLMRTIGQDPSLTAQEKGILNNHIRRIDKDTRPDAVEHHLIDQMITLVDRDYLLRWAQVVRNGQYSIERFARCIATHLLDAGFSNNYLREVVNGRVGVNPPVPLEILCQGLHREKETHPVRDFEVMIAFTHWPKLSHTPKPIAWLSAKGVSQWLTDHGFDNAGVRPSCGIKLHVLARDVYGASDAARYRVEQFKARAAVATKPLEIDPRIWVSGADAPISMEDESRGVRIKALVQENLIFESSNAKDVDAAVELIAHLESSSPPAAIAGGWGAVEGLLADPKNRSSAAENLAILVACSYLRAELTALSHRVPTELREKIGECPTNRARAELLAQSILDEKVPEFERLSDQAAIMRVQKILLRPKAELEGIKQTLTDAFLRLYRQRNLILHGGKLDGVSLTASLRTVSKIAGAGMDRIVHGQYVQGTRPKELVARAKISLSLIDDQSSALSCLAMLEPHH